MFFSSFCAHLLFYREKIITQFIIDIEQEA